MDLESFQLANILVGNPRDLSALEATMLGPALRFTQDNIIAITGGDMMPLLDEQPVPMDQAFLVRAGSVLKLRDVYKRQRESPGRPPPDCGRDERYFS